MIFLGQATGLCGILGTDYRSYQLFAPLHAETPTLTLEPRCRPTRQWKYCY